MPSRVAVPGSRHRELEILLVEDNPGDVHLTVEALRSGDVPYRLEVISDGDEVLRRVAADPIDRDALFPDLILLDLNLTRRTGHEVLAALRARAHTRDVPVIILTSSDRDADVRASYGLQANCFVTKPADAREFMTMVQAIARYWFRLEADGAGRTTVLPRAQA